MSSKTPEEIREQRMANIRPHQYPKGKSGNPAGRPKGQSVASEIKRIITEKQERGDDIVTALAMVAIKNALKGDYRYFEVVRETIDGARASGGVSISGSMVQVVFDTLEPPPGFDPPRSPDDLVNLPEMQE